MTAIDLDITVPEMTAAVDATGDRLHHHTALELVDLLVELRDLTAAVASDLLAALPVIGGAA